MMDKIKVAGLNFDHMHMGDNLAFAEAHPDVELVALCDERPPRMRSVQERLGLDDVAIFTDWELCLRESEPDLVLLCPSTGEHALWVERVAPYGCHMIVEKPFAASLLDARRMMAAAQAGGGVLAINWPLAWYPPHVTAKRLIDEGVIGVVRSVNYYDGNRGPLYHLDGKIETSESFRSDEKSQSWFYKKSMGGGSLLDYLGYGATLGTWFLGGEAPSDVTCVVDQPTGLEVDEHSITVARYPAGLCRFETRWGTFTDPWTHQPQPKCGFEIVGERGTITSYDYEESVRIQTLEAPQGVVVPVDVLEEPMQNPIQYMVHCLRSGQQIAGPLSPELSYTGQRIVDSAVRSAAEGKTVELLS
jgi:glucose-fructose oxidoreductase